MVELTSETGAADAAESEAGVVRREPRARRRGRLATRRWSRADKWRIVEESYRPGTSVSLVARRYDVNANQVFNWRREAREGRLGKPPAGVAGRGETAFLQIGTIGADGGICPAGADPTRPEPEKLPSRGRASNDTGAVDPGVIEIVLPDGVRLRAGAQVDDETLRRVLAVVRGA